MPPTASLRTPLPEPLGVGEGTALFVDGTIGRPEQIDALQIAVGAERHDALGWGMAVPGGHERDYWWGIVELQPIARDTRLPVALELRLRDRSRHRVELGPLELVPRLPRLASEPARAAAERARATGSGPLVAICMATFDPDPELFRRQIASIVAQTHERWICLLSDDASPPEALGAVERELGGDPRFVLHRAGHRAGFYGNFERALRMVPAGVELVALADQDDHWYPDKLQALIEALGDGASLAYSDMRIVDRDGQRLADTYWGYRRNNYTDLGSLLIANTVTGAASLFSASLLDRVLPFPPKHSNLFHDHWIAQVAICAGEVAYVDRPLYDYVQHGEAAIGHRAANAGGRYQVPLASRLRAGWQQLRSHRFRPAWRAPYFNVYCRVALCMVVLRLRCGPTMSPERLAELERVGAGRPGLSWLLRRSLRDLGGVTETIGRERVMLAGLAWRGSAELRKRLRAARQRRSLPESRP